MVKKGQLTAKQTDFIEFYTTLGADTYNNAMQSAIKAGYSPKTADKSIQQVLGNKGVKAGIEKARAANRVNSLSSVEDIRDMHKELFDKAVQTSDLALARLNLQDLGRTYAAYSDKHVVDNSFNIEVTRFSKQIEAATNDLPVLEADTGHQAAIDGDAD